MTTEQEVDQAFAATFREAIHQFISLSGKLGSDLASYVSSASIGGKFKDEKSGRDLQFKLIIGNPGFDDEPEEDEEIELEEDGVPYHAKAE